MFSEKKVHKRIISRPVEKIEEEIIEIPKIRFEDEVVEVRRNRPVVVPEYVEVPNIVEKVLFPGAC